MSRSCSSLLRAASLLLLLAAAGANAGTRRELLAIRGSSPGDGLGQSVSAIGDLDGDGVDDLVIGARFSDTAIVASGADGSTLLAVWGEAGSDFGFSVAGAGDVDGDGTDDFVVGAPFATNGGGDTTGSATVFSGADGGTIHTFYGDGQADYFGYSVAAAGDVDGDGYADVVAGAPFALDGSGDQKGLARLFSGQDGSALRTLYGGQEAGEGASGGFGTALCAGADVDGDGVPDLVVGAPFQDDASGKHSGMVRVFSGADGAVVHTFLGGSDLTRFGVAVSAAEDLDGDGYADVAVGADMATNGGGLYTGSVTVYSGQDGSTLFTVFGSRDGGSFGRAVALAGDLDRDGVNDLLVGDPDDVAGNGVAGGSVRGCSGKDGTTLFTLFGPSENCGFGEAVAAAGDLDGESIRDIAVGCPRDDRGGADAGAVFAYGLPLPRATVSIDSGAAVTSDADVSLSIGWNLELGSIADMRIRDGGGVWGEWEPAAATKDWSLPAGDGAKVVEVEVRDDVGLVSEPAPDDILLDTGAPSGSVAIAGGAPWTNVLLVRVNLGWSDAVSWVTDARVRRAGDDWGAFAAVTAQVLVTLPTGDGQRSVEAQFRDAAGNLSAVLSDSIGVDMTPPTGTVAIEGGAEFAKPGDLALAFAATDPGGSGVAEVRWRFAGGTFGPWVAYGPEATATLPGSVPEGSLTVEAQFRDAAGNSSAVASDSITVDTTGPTIGSVVVCAGRPYVLPEEPLTVVVTATEPAGGSGLAEIAATFDDGSTYLPWTPFASGDTVSVPRPAASGLVFLRVAVRDALGNESTPSTPVPIYLVEAAPPFLGAGGKAAGAISAADDFDAIELSLVAGDVLSIKVKASGGTKTDPFLLAIDLARPDGRRLFTGRYPLESAATGVTGFAVAETGRYLLVLRVDAGVGPPSGSYALTVSVKHAKSAAGGKGVTSAGSVEFDAAAGSTFSASLKGAGLDPASVRLVLAADGSEITAPSSGKPGQAKVGPATLGTVTGRYRLEFAATGPVTFSWRVKPPKASALVE